MNYAPFEKLPVKLDSIDTNTNCMYKERKYNVHSNKCNNTDTLKMGEYITDNNTIDECKLLYTNRIQSNIVSNKNDNQLTSRIIKTIPYRNYSEFTYNPELEILINAGMHTNTKKSVGNTSEIQGNKTPMLNYVKKKIENKNNSFDISRYQLSSRQIKGNKRYIRNYKKNIKKIKSSLIQNE